MIKRLQEKNLYLPLCIAVAVFGIGGSMAHPVTPTMIIERGLDSSLFGTAFAAMCITSFLSSPFWGKLCNYVSTRKLMVLGAFGYIVGQTIFGFCTNGAMAIIGRSISGIFVGGLYTALPNYIINTSQPGEVRSRALTVNQMVQSVASAVGYFLGGMLGVISVNTTIIGMIIFLAAGGILFHLLTIDDTSFKHKPEKPFELKDANPFSAFIESRNYMNRQLFFFLSAVVFAGMGQVCLEQVFNYYIKDQLGMSSAYNGTFKAVIAVTTIILNMTLNMWLIRKTDIMKSYPAVLAAQLLPMIAMIFIKNKLAFSAMYILFSTANAVRNPLQQNVAAAQTTPENSNSLIGFYHSLGSFGSVFGALFAGLIYDYDPFLPFRLAAVLFAAGIALSLVFSTIHSRKGSAEGSK
ncbi:MAG: MFS transporter [Firmicutes bacterium]|nr:MFS transporter [Bacillota bacterium]